MQKTKYAQLNKTCKEENNQVDIYIFRITRIYTSSSEGKVIGRGGACAVNLRLIFGSKATIPTIKIK